MKKLFAALVLCLLLCTQASGVILIRRDGADTSFSVDFDGSDDYFDITDHASLSKGNGDDVMWITWVYITDNSGTKCPLIFSTDTWQAYPSMNWGLCADSQANPNQLEAEISDNSTSCVILGTSSTVPEDEWAMLVMTYDDSTGDADLWSCSRGGTCTSQRSATCAGLGAVNEPEWYIGKDQGGDAAKWWQHETAYFVYYIGTIYNQTQLEALASGTQANFEAEASTATFMLDDDMATDLGSGCGGSGCTVTAYGSPSTSSRGPFD
jgi:hypothetical protein